MGMPVKVSINKVTHLAHTIDITHTGARLGALRTQLENAKIISLQRGPQRAKSGSLRLDRLPRIKYRPVSNLWRCRPTFGESTCLRT